MKTINCWNDLAAFGIIPLTGESCGLMYRILFDCTEQGRRIIGKCLGLPALVLAEPWNSGSKDDPHVGSIMLSHELLVPIAVFALLETGCTECWLHTQGNVVGFERSDAPEQIERYRSIYDGKIARRLGYRGTAGDRNVHQMSGRVQ